MSHGSGERSEWVARWAHLAEPGTPVLDLACGHGRHLRWWAARGHPVTGVDRSAEALASLAGIGEMIAADIENEAWPLAGRQFGVVVVTNYLWRPLLPVIVASVAPGGLLLYETFADGQAAYGRPSRHDFLLQHGELLRACAGLRVLGYEDGLLREPDRCMQRLAALRPVKGQIAAERTALPRPGAAGG